MKTHLNAGTIVLMLSLVLPACEGFVCSQERIKAIELAKTLGFPLVIRPSFTLGGVGGDIAYNIEEFRDLAERGIELSPVHEIPQRCADLFAASKGASR